MHQVATLAGLAPGAASSVEIGDLEILLVRDGDLVHAYRAACPHAGAPLGEGAVCEGRIVCPWHKASFDLRSGALLEPPALEPLTRYPVLVEDGRVMVSTEAVTPPPRRDDEHAADDRRCMLIVGAGAAGTAAACALREFGFSGRIVLLGHEAGDPYDRTALSKFVLQGAMPPDQATPLRDAAFYRAHRIERLHDEAVGLDQAARRLALRGGSFLDYDQLLIATGGTPRPLPVPGGERPGVHTLRSREDAAAILDRIEGDAARGRAAQVVVAGASFIGLEAASALRERQIPVTVVSPDELPFAAQLGTPVGAMFRRLHERHGVRFLGRRRLARIEGDPATSGVVLDDGQRLPATLVLVGLGILPASGFASGLRRTEDGGIVVDAAMRAADHVFAAGDVARFPLGAREQVRVEHWRVAQQHARIAAAGMLGQVARLDQPPFFWTYHYGKRYEYFGLSQDLDRVEIDGDLDAGDFLVRLMHQGEVVGIVACGREAETAALITRQRFAGLGGPSSG